MKTKYSLLLFTISLLSIAAIGFISNNDADFNSNSKMTIQQVALDGNNIKSFIWNNGILNQNFELQNTPGFEWPKGNGTYAVFTSGLTLAAYVNNQLRMAVAAWGAEYAPGYCINGVFNTDNRFRIYKVKRGDNFNNNSDWLNWGSMVPYGAPYIDHNNNGVYEYFIDTPGVKSASETIFICLTDADPTGHNYNTGFGGGTQPLGAEVHLTAWCYDNPGYQDMQFVKWAVINKSTSSWDSLYTTIFNDPDLGNFDDDYIGCDSTRDLAYCYNGDNNDNGSSYGYGLNPPAVGFMFLNCSGNNIHMTASNFVSCNGCANYVTCEGDAFGATEAYWCMKGFKKDGTPFVIPYTAPPKTTKFVYSGDPETDSGWTEHLGKVNNCGGSLSGTIISPTTPADRRLLLHSGPKIRMNPGDTQVVQICELIARGANNLNSVTKLKQLSDSARHLCETGFVIGITPLSTEVPGSFALYQNYPNPFNPATKIRFDVPNLIPPLKGESTNGARGMIIKLTIYDALGREIATLVNEQLNPGTYAAEWDGTNYPSGVYFYRLEGRQAGSSNGDFFQTRKLVLLK